MPTLTLINIHGAIAGARLGSDMAGANGDLSVFWITNPDNTLEGNAAAATEGWGFFVHTRWPTVCQLGVGFGRASPNSSG